MGTRIMVSYTSAMHFSYLLHGVVAAFVPVVIRERVALSVGTLFMQSDRSALSGIAFAEHKLLDVIGHLAGGIRCPWRFDHWLMLISHICRYLGRPIYILEHYTVPKTYVGGK